ncbi:MAG TPA: hypothetical protein VFV38_42435 [Ktedonobacteraceae bacterium]|nr:hypothetical protein [Ktedonobacteraceae bacterium]
MLDTTTNDGYTRWPATKNDTTGGCSYSSVGPIFALEQSEKLLLFFYFLPDDPIASVPLLPAMLVWQLRFEETNYHAGQVGAPSGVWACPAQKPSQRDDCVRRPGIV